MTNAMPSPVEVMASINAMADALDHASKEQYAAVIDLGVKEVVYRKAFEVEVVKLKIAADRGEERLPAEDVRKALAHSMLPAGVYEDYVAAAAKVDAMKARARAIESAMTGKQSVLKMLNAEANV